MLERSSDTHAIDAVESAGPGLPQEIRSIVDTLQSAGKTPGAIYGLLCNDVRVKALVATYEAACLMRMIKNRGRTGSRARKGPLLLESSLDLLEFGASNEFPSTVEEFDAMENIHEMRVLSQGYRADVQAIVLSTLACLSNLMWAELDRPGGFSLMVDGTFKLHWGGWVLVVAGVLSLQWSDTGLGNQFRPAAYCFCRSESSRVVALLLNALKVAAQRCAPPRLY